MSHQIYLKVLRALKPHLVHEVFVCCAASRAESYRKITPYECDVFKAMIYKRIEGRYTVTTWLREVKGFLDVVDAPYKVTLDYRQRWVDSMIEEFSQ